MILKQYLYINHILSIRYVEEKIYGKRMSNMTKNQQILRNIIRLV